MTPLQKAVLDFVKSYDKLYGYSPTYMEIAEACGLKSKSQVAGLADALVLKGYLKKSSARASRCLEVTDSSVGELRTLLSQARTFVPLPLKRKIDLALEGASK